MSGYQRVGDWMVHQGVLTPEQRDHALEVQKNSKRRFGEAVVSLGYATEEVVAKCLGEQYDIPLINLKSVSPSNEALRLLTPTFALSRLVYPYKVTENELHCVIGDPLDLQATDYITKTTGKRLVLSIAGPIELFEVISEAYTEGTSKTSLSKSSGLEVVQAKTGGATKATKQRKVKVHEQSDRKQLLGALAGSGPNPIWDFYEVN